MTEEQKDDYLLTLSCKDRPGLVAGVTHSIFEAGGNIEEAQQFTDPDSQRFFMRVRVGLRDPATGRARLEELLQQQANAHIDWQLRNINERKKVLLMVSKLDHCLVDLLYRVRIGELPMEVVGIVSNHPKKVHNITMVSGIPFHYIPVTPDTKLEQEAKVKELIAEQDVDLVVLARYMQILSDDFSNYLRGRCINIHHSFLPGFKGAKPYHQAYERGVKMIGATAHFVTADLDEGPIITQNVEHVSHSDTPPDLVAKGRDIERRVLSYAVDRFIHDRIFLCGHKTIVF